MHLATPWGTYQSPAVVSVASVAALEGARAQRLWGDGEAELRRF